MINISRNSVRISFFLFLAATVFPQAAYAQIFDLDSATRIVSSQFCVSITAADANQDGRPDVAITCNLRSDGLLNVDDTGAWTSTIIWRGHREPRNQVALSDIDLDGDIDADAIEVPEAGLGGALLTLLGQPEDQRMFSAIATRLAPGTALPAPTGVFPRYQAD